MNSNVGDKIVLNSVSIRKSNSADLIGLNELISLIGTIPSSGWEDGGELTLAKYLWLF